MTRFFSSADAIDLHISERRDAFAVLDAAKLDTQAAAERRLTDLYFTDPDALAEEWAQREYARLTDQEREDVGYRYWANETMGSRL